MAGVLFAGGYWTAAEQAAFFRAHPPRLWDAARGAYAPPDAADATIARAVAFVTPTGCYGVVHLDDRPYPCRAPVVAGRLFCAVHAHLGWCDRACAWTAPRSRQPARPATPPAPAPPPRPPTPPPAAPAPPARPPRPPGWPYRRLSWSAVAARIAERNRTWVNAPALPARIDPRAEEQARRDAVRLAVSRAQHGERVAVWTSASPVWAREPAAGRVRAGPFPTEPDPDERPA